MQSTKARSSQIPKSVDMSTFSCCPSSLANSAHATDIRLLGEAAVPKSPSKRGAPKSDPLGNTFKGESAHSCERRLKKKKQKRKNSPSVIKLHRQGQVCHPMAPGSHVPPKDVGTCPCPHVLPAAAFQPPGCYLSSAGARQAVNLSHLSVNMSPS